MRTLLALAAAASATIAPAHAQIIVDQIERLDVERGESEWEVQAIHAVETDDESSVGALNLSAEFGVHERIALGFELETEREGAEDLQTEMIALQAKFVALDPAEAPLGLGAQLSLGRSTHGSETEAELRLLAERRFSGLALASDVTLESALEGDEEHDVFVRYAARLDWARQWGVLALEAGGDWGSFDDLRWSSDDSHWLGPVIGVELARLEIEAGAFVGLTEATPDSQFRIEIALR